MENIFWNMNLFVIVTVLSLVKYGVHGGCVADKTATVKPCFDQLKTNMESQNPTDINDFLCGDSQKDRLDCVIKGFNDCRDFKDESFIGDLKHASGFHAKDLFHVSSADEFCKCAPTFTCMEKIETEKLGIDLDEGPWEQIANQEYICGLGRNNIDCVAKSLPTCVDYLQYKHNETVGDNLEGHVDVNSLQYASNYAERQCKNWPDEDNDHVCTMKRVGWQSVEYCHDDIDHLVKDSDKICGMRSCVEKAMSTCPKGEMEYFIDAINVFSDTKISTVKCSSAKGIVASMFSTIFLCLVCILF
ncbi:uncharacterized protein LOC123554374 [Mercenaria mercenaria]|uniref:uncharacterized protein LOC123554374 n=1 Tax=Mercenaria mercenaria TaxID=6596 RepID=UPI00234E75AF|nr:uncharacterized protein LOC123554374 [Mercenaria mercenaria]